MDNVIVEDNEFSNIVEEPNGQFGRRSFTGYNRGYYDLPNGARLIFVTLTSTGVKEQGHEFGGYFLSKVAAKWYLDKAIEDYIKDKEGVLHWRMFPDLCNEHFYREEFDPISGKMILTPITLWSAVCRIAVDPFIPDILCGTEKV